MQENLQECFRCHVVKPLSEFYKHPEMANGHLGKCKECNKKDVQDNYRARKGQYTEYYKKREKTDHRKAWRFDEGKRARARNPIKYHCHVVTGNAIRSGFLVKQPCRICGTSKVEAHHSDYNFPLTVDWLCFKHHRELHYNK